MAEQAVTALVVGLLCSFVVLVHWKLRPRKADPKLLFFGAMFRKLRGRALCRGRRGLYR